MLTYALVDSKLTRPSPKARGICRACKSPVISVCGSQVTHHWRHESIEDCDSWSENVGPWHSSWQGLAQADAVEVPLGDHRADIIGNDDIVIELQHSPISPDDINARESFYGDMVWVFDATFRFAVIQSGELGFFSFGRTKHIDCCQKPVYLDFGNFLVEVVSLNKLIEQCHGYGTIRSHEWFASRFLSTVRENSQPIAIQPSSSRQSSPWEREEPFWHLRHPTLWMCSDRSVETLPKWTPYYHINGLWRGTGQLFTTDFINDHPLIANGWKVKSLSRMKSLLSAKPCIIEGKLRLLPAAVDQMARNTFVANYKLYVDELENHIAFGRVPMLKETTKQRLRSLAESSTEKGMKQKLDERTLF